MKRLFKKYQHPQLSVWLLEAEDDILTGSGHQAGGEDMIVGDDEEDW